MYHYILNPHDLKYYFTNSSTGKFVLKQYLNQLNGGKKPVKKSTKPKSGKKQPTFEECISIKNSSKFARCIAELPIYKHNGGSIPDNIKSSKGDYLSMGFTDDIFSKKPTSKQIGLIKNAFGELSKNFLVEHKFRIDSNNNVFIQNKKTKFFNKVNLRNIRKIFANKKILKQLVNRHKSAKKIQSIVRKNIAKKNLNVQKITKALEEGKITTRFPDYHKVNKALKEGSVTTRPKYEYGKVDEAIQKGHVTTRPEYTYEKVDEAIQKGNVTTRPKYGKVDEAIQKGHVTTRPEYTYEKVDEAIQKGNVTTRPKYGKVNKAIQKGHVITNRGQNKSEEISIDNFLLECDAINMGLSWNLMSGEDIISFHGSNHIKDLFEKKVKGKTNKQILLRELKNILINTDFEIVKIENKKETVIDPRIAFDVYSQKIKTTNPIQHSNLF